MGMPDWCPDPVQTVNYVSCHDNMTLYDRILASAPEATAAEQIRMNNLAAAFSLLSQGVPFFQAGEEILRSKPTPDGFYADNSYNMPDEINAIRWDSLEDPVYQEVLSYYRGLIAFRKAHPGLRLTRREEVLKTVRPIPCADPLTVAFEIREKRPLLAIFHAGKEPVTIPLPAGKWHAYIRGSKAGNQPLSVHENSVTVPPISAMVLRRGPGVKKLPGILGGAALAASAIGTALWIAVRKRK